MNKWRRHNNFPLPRIQGPNLNPLLSRESREDHLHPPIPKACRDLSSHEDNFACALVAQQGYVYLLWELSMCKTFPLLLISSIISRLGICISFLCCRMCFLSLSSLFILSSFFFVFPWYCSEWLCVILVCLPCTCFLPHWLPLSLLSTQSILHNFSSFLPCKFSKASMVPSSFFFISIKFKKLVHLKAH